MRVKWNFEVIWEDRKMQKKYESTVTMSTVQINNHDIFANKAISLALPVYVVRSDTVIPVECNNTVIMRPAAMIDYTLDFEDPQYGLTRWTFKEVVPTNENGELSLSTNLWKQLTKSSAHVILSHRSVPSNIDQFEKDRI